MQVLQQYHSLCKQSEMSSCQMVPWRRPTNSTFPCKWCRCAAPFQQMRARTFAKALSRHARVKLSQRGQLKDIYNELSNVR